MGGRRWLRAARRVAAEVLRSQFLQDVRRYGATYLNYVGKPLSYVLATPARPDDADNPLRIAFGNEGAPRTSRGSPAVRLHASSTASARPRAAS